MESIEQLPKPKSSIAKTVGPLETSRSSEQIYDYTVQHAPVTVLLVDDQPIVAESIRRLLAIEEDVRFYYCREAKQAIPTALEVAPTIILQDLVMPDVDGLMLVKFFRANPATHNIPIIVLSNKEEATIKAEAFATGANDYLVKLPDPIELIARIRYHSKAYINFLKRDEAERTLAYNKELERRVEERTAKLTQALNELRQTQAQLVHNEKMSSLGQLVAGIAHEINNPINFIHGNLSHIQKHTHNLISLLNLYKTYHHPPAQPVTDFSEDIDAEFLCEDLPKIVSSLDIGSERIRNLVLSLRIFSRIDEAPVKAINIHEGLESSLLILKHRLGNIELVKDYGEIPLVECYPSQLNQVFMNLLANAIDALEERNQEIGNKRQEKERAQIPVLSAQLEEGSQIEPSAQTLDLKTHNSLSVHKQPTITIQTKAETDTITILIHDNGPGIPDEVKERIFNPFFTTKTVGKGTGLGLSISHQIIVDKHQGTLACYSAPEEGTTFAITIAIALNPSEQ